MKKVLIFALLSLSFNSTMAQDLGVFGRTYSIAERNLLTLIIERLTLLEKSGDIKKHQDLLREKILEPKAVTDIETAKINAKRVFDPSINYQQQRFNPLHQVSLDTPLLFINGRNASQLRWVETQLQLSPNSKVILIAGNPRELAQKWQRPVYFDQAGKISKRLAIQAVPSRVTQEQNHLLIEEISL